jgi:serine/threonine-protein kinase RsbW
MPHESALHKGANETSGGSPQFGNTLVSLTFQSTFRRVRRAIQDAMPALRTLDLTKEELGSVEIVLAEALNNVVEHAYPKDAPGEVGLVIRARRAGILIEIRDCGEPMPNGRVPQGAHPMAVTETDTMPEGGYGWFMIRELARDLIYDRRDGENFLIFRIAVGG